jgi:hypothetical protein
VREKMSSEKHYFPVKYFPSQTNVTEKGDGTEIPERYADIENTTYFNDEWKYKFTEKQCRTS